MVRIHLPPAESLQTPGPAGRFVAGLQWEPQDATRKSHPPFAKDLAVTYMVRPGVILAVT
jgi:hypothetical protein